MNELKEVNDVWFNEQGELVALKGVCKAKNFKDSFQVLNEELTQKNN